MTANPATLGVPEAPPSEFSARYAGASREVYRQRLHELAEGDSRIFCLDTDMGGLDEAFAAYLPNQYVELGIAEANLMSVAAALAASGKIPFVNTMASFAACRACEQVKIDIAYNNVPVKIVATHAGLSGGHFGPTHQALEDLAIMRSFPNFTVLVPADAYETVRAVEAAVTIPGPVYIRLGRQATPLIHQEEDDFLPGTALTLRGGTDITLIAAGSFPVLWALDAAKQLATMHFSARVLNLHTLKPLDVSSIVAAARETRGVITVEDHSIIGGLGSAVAEALVEQAPAPLRRIGIPDTFCDRVGKHQELLESFGVSAERIVQVALSLLGEHR